MIEFYDRLGFGGLEWRNAGEAFQDYFPEETREHTEKI